MQFRNIQTFKQTSKNNILVLLESLISTIKISKFYLCVIYWTRTPPFFVQNSFYYLVIHLKFNFCAFFFIFIKSEFLWPGINVGWTRLLFVSNFLAIKYMTYYVTKRPKMADFLWGFWSKSFCLWTDSSHFQYQTNLV